jgi:hypothetical protein
VERAQRTHAEEFYEVTDTGFGTTELNQIRMGKGLRYCPTSPGAGILYSKGITTLHQEMHEYKCWTFAVPCYILKDSKMRSSLIGKIEKAKRYAQEPGRVTFSGLTAVFRGENDNHKLSYANGKWHCTCHFFSQWEICSHVMALQQILGDMLPKEARVSPMETQTPEK